MVISTQLKVATTHQHFIITQTQPQSITEALTRALEANTS